VVHSQPDTSRVPASIRPLVERCLEKDSRRRPTAGEIVTGLGATRPAADWRPGPAGNETPSAATWMAPVTGRTAFRSSPPVAPSTLTARPDGHATAATWPARAAQVPPRPGRRRGRGPALIAVAVVAALSAVALTVSLRQSATAQPTPPRPAGPAASSRPASPTARVSTPAAPSASVSTPAAPSASGQAGLPTGYNQYVNPRFGFTVLWPATFNAQPPPEDGDGQSWAGPGGQVQLSAYGASNTLGYSPEQDEAADASGLSVTYRHITGNVVTVSGYKDNGQTIFYQRDVVGPGSIDTLYWSYPASQKTQWDAAVTETAKTFHPGDISTAH